MKNWTAKLCNVERDRLTAAEICIDEIMTIMERHDEAGSQMYFTLLGASQDIHAMLTLSDGPRKRRDRLIKIRRALTDAMPMTDEDLEAGPTAMESAS